MPEKLKALERVKDLVLEITASEDERVIKGIASTSSRDRDDDRLMVDEWKLDTYKTNPVFLWGHDSFEPAIATVRDIKVEGGKLLFEALFPTEGTYKKADEIYGLYKQGILKTFSVRFRSTDYKQNEFGGYDFKELELLEISAVNIPANPDAVVTEVKKLKDIEGNKNNSQEGEKDMDEKILAMLKGLEAKIEKMETDQAEKEKAARDAQTAAEKAALEAENAELKKNLEEMKTNMSDLQESLEKMKEKEDERQKEEEGQIGKIKGTKTEKAEYFGGIRNKSADIIKVDAKRLAGFVKAIVGGDKVEAKSLAENNDVTGGYLVPEDFRARVWQIMEQSAIARRLATNWTMSGNTLQVPSMSDKPAVTWTTEAGNITVGQPNFGQIVLTALKASLIVPLTNELLEDSAVNLTQLLTRMFAEQMGVAEDEQAFTGDGTVFTGILGDANVPTISMASGNTSFDNITIKNIRQMIASIPSTLAENGRFLVHRTMWPTIKDMKDSNGNYVLPQNIENTLLDYPVIKTDRMPNYLTDGADKPMMVFGNFDGMYFGDRRELRVDLATEATVGDVNLFEQDMVALRAKERVAITIAEPKAFVTLKTAAA